MKNSKWCFVLIAIVLMNVFESCEKEHCNERTKRNLNTINQLGLNELYDSVRWEFYKVNFCDSVELFNKYGINRILDDIYEEFLPLTLVSVSLDSLFIEGDTVGFILSFCNGEGLYMPMNTLYFYEFIYFDQHSKDLSFMNAEGRFIEYDTIIYYINHYKHPIDQIWDRMNSYPYYMYKSRNEKEKELIKYIQSNPKKTNSWLWNEAKRRGHIK